jgi:hypothetical protein
MSEKPETLEEEVDLLIENQKLREEKRTLDARIKTLTKEKQVLTKSISKYEKEKPLSFPKRDRGIIEYVGDLWDHLKYALTEEYFIRYVGNNTVSGIKGTAVLGLAAAYSTELYFLAPLLHAKMHGLAQKWHVNYAKLQEAYVPLGDFRTPARLFEYPPIQYFLSNALVGGFLGALTGAALGALASYTFNLIANKNFAPLEAVAQTVGCCALSAAGGGLLGAEFSGPEGIMIGSYIGSAVGLGVAIQADNFTE